MIGPVRRRYSALELHNLTLLAYFLFVSRGVASITHGTLKFVQRKSMSELFSFVNDQIQIL